MRAGNIAYLGGDRNRLPIKSGVTYKQTNFRANWRILAIQPYLYNIKAIPIKSLNFPMHQVFISYARDQAAGQALAKELHQTLRRQQIPAFLDEEGIDFGQRWDKTLESAVVNCKLMLWVVSTASHDRQWQERELITAQQQKIHIIPVLAEDTHLPMQVNNQQAAFLFGEQKQSQLDKLLLSVNQYLGIDQIRPLVEKARAAKRNHAYAEALEQWEQVLVINAGHPLAHHEISQLQHQQAQQLRGTQLLGQLAPRMGEIQPVCAQVAGLLTQAASGAEVPALMDYTQQFIDGESTAEQYTALCQALLNQTGSGQNTAGSSNYAAFTQRVIKGEIVLFIGSGLAQEYQPSSIIGEQALAQTLADKASFRDFQGSLSSIAEYYRLNNEYGENRLLEELQRSLGNRDNDIHLYTLLSHIDTPLILVSAAYDNHLENSFDATGKPYVELSSVINLYEGHEAGHVVVRFSDEAQPTRSYTKENLSHLKLLEEGYSLIYKIRGTCPTDNLADELKRDSLTLSESHYFTFARHAEKMVPDYLTRHFRNRGFLFLGFRPQSWEERLLVTALLDKRKNATEPCYTVGIANDPIEEIYWASRNVRQYDVDMRTLDEHLAEALS